MDNLASVAEEDSFSEDTPQNGDQFSEDNPYINICQASQPPTPPRQRPPKPLPRRSFIARPSVHTTSPVVSPTSSNYEHCLPKEKYDSPAIPSPPSPTPEPNAGSDYDPQELPPWYWGKVTRIEAEDKLRNLPNGTFLIRDSTTPGDFALTVRQDGHTKCLKIMKQGDCYGLKMNDCSFTTLTALVEHYSIHSLAEFNKRLTTCLLSYPPRTATVVKGTVYNSLSSLADMSRKLQEAKLEYVSLMKQHEQANNILNECKIQEKALLLVQRMYENGFAEGQKTLKKQTDDLDDLSSFKELSPEQEKKLDENQKLSIKRHQAMHSLIGETNRHLLEKEQDVVQIMIAINDHVTVLRDREEKCQQFREQALEYGGKRELIECLMEDKVESTMFHPNEWLVECTRDEAESHLRGERAGTFLIRPKDNPLKPYALSIVCTTEDDIGSDVKHCEILHPTGRGYGFQPEGAVFESIDELVSKHSRTSIKLYFKHMDTCLAYPVFGVRPRSSSELTEPSAGIGYRGQMEERKSR